MSLPDELLLAGPEDTRDAGRSLGSGLGAGDVVALTGELGAGKTHFCQGVVAGLDSTASVASPTFGLVHEYLDGRLPVFHFDFYRLESDEELLELGWDDYVDREGVVLVEWADRYARWLPQEAQWWHLSHDLSSGGRRLQRR